ncbi:MAG: PAS domain-containing sensor histidine kinase [Rhodospirillales bacterium]|nr:PAS domain-containing sensor histidine kinase [Rhodospirillales bacterium]MCB9995453.1 PAS domain-containing sensor histidine kinase [Rhodospirillales bacterium]
MTGNMAQLTVLLTGIVLTVTAYAILNILIQQMIQDDFQRTVKGTQRSISERLVGLEQSVITMASMAGLLAANVSEAEMVQRINYAVSQTRHFDHVLFVRNNADHNSWRVIEVWKHENSPVSTSSESFKGLVQAVLARQNGRDAKAVTTLSAPPGMVYWQENSDPVVKVQPFVLARKVMMNGQEIGVIIGISRVSHAIDLGWLQNRMSLRRIVITDLSSGDRLYYMNRNQDNEEMINLDQNGENISFTVGGDTWQLNLAVGQDQRIRFLENTPWLMLVFGITLTLIGTFYVRNNQRQSYKLAIMNRELAQKNYDLNSEISERERLNQVLRKAEREYKAIIDSVSDIIFETSVNGEIVFLNDTWSKVTGFDIEQALGRNLFELLHPQDQEEQRSNFEMLVKGKKSAYRAFTRLRSSNGTFRSVEIAMSMLRQDENRNMRVVGTLTDVEERRRAEKALSEAEKKYRTIVENAAGGIYQVTPEGQFLSANPAMARVLGYETPEQMLREVRNAHDHLYVRARDRAHFIRELETIGMVQNFETEVRVRNGNIIWVNENARAVKDDDGNILYYEGSMEDITSRKQAEQKLREAKVQSDMANRAKSEFLANMSHELRTPLNAIIGFAEIIRNEVLGPLDNRQYWEYAKDIHESGQKLLTIINEILDVSRIEAGDRQINEGHVRMDKVVRSCIDFMSQKAGNAHLTIVNMTEGKIPDVIGEELAIKQVLINLLGNAIKYTPGEGRITVSCEVEKNGEVRLSITDTGIGMEEHEIAKALSPFGQVETALNRSDSGAGLGLTLVESLMKLHEGRLELFSQKGIGTTATVIFPAKRIVRDAGSDKVTPEQKDGDGDKGASSHQIH